jgi:hypothetical protein
MVSETEAALNRWLTDAEEDRDKLGEAFAILYDQALNGVICDPHMQPCDSCKRGFELGREVLDRLDPKWGNFGRPGPKFQPDGAALPKKQNSMEDS